MSNTVVKHFWCVAAKQLKFSKLKFVMQLNQGFVSSYFFKALLREEFTMCLMLEWVSSYQTLEHIIRLSNKLRLSSAGTGGGNLG